MKILYNWIITFSKRFAGILLNFVVPPMIKWKSIHDMFLNKRITGLFLKIKRLNLKVAAVDVEISKHDMP